jgi:hypothetical protein
MKGLFNAAGGQPIHAIAYGYDAGLSLPRTFDGFASSTDAQDEFRFWHGGGTITDRRRATYHVLKTAAEVAAALMAERALASKELLDAIEQRGWTKGVALHLMTNTRAALSKKPTAGIAL